MHDKRRHPRKAVDLPVEYEWPEGARHSAAFRDLSLGGGFIVIESPPPYESKLRLEIHFPGLEGRVRVDATVRWVQRDGMGVQFGVMGARETHALVALLG